MHTRLTHTSMTRRYTQAHMPKQVHARKLVMRCAYAQAEPIHTSRHTDPKARCIHAHKRDDVPTHKRSAYAITHRPANMHTSVMMCLHDSRAHAAMQRPAQARVCMDARMRRTPYTQAECSVACCAATCRSRTQLLSVIKRASEKHLLFQILLLRSCTYTEAKRSS